MLVVYTTFELSKGIRHNPFLLLIYWW